MGECTQLSRVRLLVLHQGKLRDLVVRRFLQMDPLKQRTEKKAFTDAQELRAKRSSLGRSHGSLGLARLAQEDKSFSSWLGSERKRAKLWKGIIKGKPLEKLCQALMMIWLFELWRSATYEGG